MHMLSQNAILGGLCMGTRITDLHCKEVICVTDGRRLGFVEDVRIELPEGKVVAVIVPCPCRLFFPRTKAEC